MSTAAARSFSVKPLLVVNVPVADLRKDCASDSSQESQLLYGEQALLKEKREGWLFVEAIEQRRFRPETGWTGYPGWIEAHQACEIQVSPNYNLIVKSPWTRLRVDPGPSLFICLGTRLQGIEKQGEEWTVRSCDGSLGWIDDADVLRIGEEIKDWRHSVLAEGMKFLGHPYLWGGRSVYKSHESAPKTSVDCSGFVNLIYRLHGIDIPRDAHDQAMACQRLESTELKPADLIFWAKADNPQRITHVMLFAGGDAILDTNGKDRKVVLTSSQERFGKSLSSISYGEKVGEYFLYFGRV